MDYLICDKSYLKGNENKFSISQRVIVLITQLLSYHIIVDKN